MRNTSQSKRVHFPRGVIKGGGCGARQDKIEPMKVRQTPSKAANSSVGGKSENMHFAL